MFFDSRQVINVDSSLTINVKRIKCVEQYKELKKTRTNESYLNWKICQWKEWLLYQFSQNFSMCLWLRFPQIFVIRDRIIEIFKKRQKVKEIAKWTYKSELEDSSLNQPMVVSYGLRRDVFPLNFEILPCHRWNYQETQTRLCFDSIFSVVHLYWV